MDAPLEELLLGPMDLVMPRCYTRVIFLFEHLPSDEILSKSFHRLVRREYLPWTGRLKSRAGGRYSLVYSKENPVDAPLVIRSAPDGMSFASLGGPKLAFASPMPVSFAHERLFPTPDMTPFMAHISRFKDGTDAGAVAITLHHCVGDGGSLFGFMHSWCIEARGGFVDRPEESLAVHNRSVIPIAEQVPTRVPEEYKILPSDSTTTETPPNLPSMSVRLLHFSAAALATIKTNATVGQKEVGQFVSTNDSLVALLWQAVTRARNLPASQSTRIGMAVNGRDKNAGIPASYAGCATYYATTSHNSAALLAMSLPELAACIRQSVARITRESMAASAAWINSIEDVVPIDPSFNSFLGPDFAVTQWAKFAEKNLYDFGLGRVSSVRIPHVSFDGLAMILPGTGGSGVDVLIGLADQAMDRLVVDESLLAPGMHVLS